jgi:tetratricopeptide (TPR) repeat protein
MMPIEQNSLASIKKEKSSAQLLFETAQQFYQQGEFQKSIEHLQTILNLPDEQRMAPGLWQAKVYHQLACCYVLLSSKSLDDTKGYIEKAKQYFEETLKANDIGLSGLAHRIRCDYGCFLYKQKDYLAASEHAQIVLQSTAKTKWLSYASHERALLPQAVQTALQHLACERITDRALAYQLSLISLQAQNQSEPYSTVLSDFMGETYQGIDPVAFDLVAQHCQQPDLAVKASDYSHWVKAELQTVDAIKALQTKIAGLALPVPVPVTQQQLSTASEAVNKTQLYAQLAQAFETMGDIYLNKQAYTQTAGLYAMAAHIRQSQLGQVTSLLDEKRSAVEQTLMKNYLANSALSLTVDTWREQQAHYHKQLTAIRKQAGDMLQNNWQPLSRKPDKDQIEKTTVIRIIFEYITQEIKSLMSRLIKDSCDLLGQPPCRYAILGLGSLARQEMTPYSDLEWAIVIEEDKASYRDYFQTMAELLSIKVTGLGETILPSLAIESLNPQYIESISQFFDDVMPRGFAMDGAMAQACKTPQGEKDRKGQKVFGLLGTPQQLAGYLAYTKEEGYGFEQHQAMTLPTVLMNADLIQGDPQLFQTYRKELQRALQATPADSKQPLYQYLMHKLLGENLKDFIPNAGSEGQLFDAKKSFYRIPSLIIDELALYYDIDLGHSSGFAKLAALRDKGILQAEAAQRLAYVLSETMRFRLQTYLHYNAQREGMNPLQQVLLPEDKAQKHHVINTNDLACITYSLQVLLPLYHTMQRFQQAPDKGRDLLSKNSLFDESLVTRGKIALRLHQYHEAEQHFKQALKQEEKSKTPTASLGNIYGYLGYITNKLADTQQAIDYHERALAIYKQVYGEQHPAVATTLNNMGTAYNSLGDAKRALTYFQQALTIDKQISGEQHPDVAISLNNMGEAYHSLGDAEQALDYYQQALTIWKQVYGEQHPNVAILQNNMGEAYRSLGDTKQALTYYQQALAIQKQVYGEQHPQVALSLNNMGLAYGILGDAKQALTYFQQALAIKKQVYGKQHPDVATSLNNMGEACRILGDVKQALTCYQQALAIQKQLHSEQHPDIATSLNNIGLAHYTLGDAKQALTYYQQALAIYKQVYGEQHPEVARSLNNMGAAYRMLGDAKQALDYYQLALAIWKQVYGEQHPDVARLLNNMGEAYRILGDAKQALTYYQQALAIIKKVYGEQHRNVATLLNNMGKAYDGLGDAKQALTYYQQALAIYEQVYGEQHPDVATLLNNMGEAYYNLGDAKQALTYYQRALAIRKHVYGEQHLDVVTLLNNMGKVYHSLGDAKQALTYFQQALILFEKPQQTSLSSHQATTSIPDDRKRSTLELRNGFFNRSAKQSFDFNTCYDTEQPKSNTVLQRLNELTGLPFTGYFRKGKNFILDAILTCNGEETCQLNQEKLRQYAIQYKVKSTGKDSFYLIVPEINSTDRDNWITAKYHEAISNQANYRKGDELNP